MNATHLPAPTNPRIHLHQEYAMRTGGYDEIARGASLRHGWGTQSNLTTFHGLVAELGLEEALRDVAECFWLSESDWSRRADLRGATCRECLEVAHA